MSRFPKFHGINLAAGAVIENLRAERLTSDPTELSAGRLWYNETDRALKFTSLNDAGGIEVQVLADAAAIEALSERLEGIESDYASTSFVEAKIAALGDALEYVGEVTPGASEAEAVDLLTLSNTASGAYYKVVAAGYVRVGTGEPFHVNSPDGLLFNGAGGVDHVDNSNSEIAGTDDYVLVSGSSDTGFTVDLAPALKARIADLEKGLSDEIAAREALAGRVSSLEGSKNDAKSAINAGRFTYQSSAAAVEHIIDHNLSSLFVDVGVWIEGDDGKYRQDIVSVEETSANRVTVSLTESAKIKAVVQVMEAL